MLAGSKPCVNLFTPTRYHMNNVINFPAASAPTEEPRRRGVHDYITTKELAALFKRCGAGLISIPREGPEKCVVRIAKEGKSVTLASNKGRLTLGEIVKYLKREIGKPLPVAPFDLDELKGAHQRLVGFSPAFGAPYGQPPMVAPMCRSTTQPITEKDLMHGARYGMGADAFAKLVRSMQRPRKHWDKRMKKPRLVNYGSFKR